MITAQNALKLPSARVSDSDREAIDGFLRDLDQYVRQNMMRGGCAMPFDPSKMNYPMAQEITRVLRHDGWDASFEVVQEKSSLTGQLTPTKHQVRVTPRAEVYDADLAVADASILS